MATLKGLISLGDHIAFMQGMPYWTCYFELGIPVLEFATGYNWQRIYSVGRYVRIVYNAWIWFCEVDVFNTTSGIFKGVVKRKRYSWATVTVLLRFRKGSAWQLQYAHTICGFLKTKNTSHLRRTVPQKFCSIPGNDMLRNFVFDICGATGDWSMDSFIEIEVKIREKVGHKKVLLVSQAE